MLDRFLNCLYDQEYLGLIIEGEATEGELLEAWNKIYLLYNNAASGGEDNPMVMKIKEVQSLNAKITFVDGAVKLLSLSYDEQLVDILNYYGLQCDLKPNEEPYSKLNIIITRAKRWVVEMKEAQNELSGMQSVETAGMSRDSFDECLISLSKYQGYGVRASEISVSQYLKTMKRMEEFYNKQLQASGH